MKLDKLKNWVGGIVEELTIPVSDSDGLSLSPLDGDAGFRRYYRLNTRPRLLAVYAPVATEDSRLFVNIACYLRQNGVRVPAVLAHDFDQGFLLIEDFGETLYLDRLNGETVDELYSEALISLLRLQQIPADHSLFAKYDETRLLDEMKLFRDWFITRCLGHTLRDSENAILNKVFEVLVASALEQPQVIVHRDFHSRNLIFNAGGAPGVIDFQDAVIGPVSYDLVSLLKDCYVYWDPPRIRHWALGYANMLADVGIISGVNETQFLQWFDWMGLQRHIKVLGIFCRLSIRDGKQRYLNDLPLVIRYTQNVIKHYPQFNEFSQWFDDSLSPLIRQQSWMQGR